MQEILAQAMTYLRGAWRFRWQALFTAWGVALVGWIFVYTMPDTYQARARVFVDTDTILRPLLNGLAVNTDTVGAINAMGAVLLSRPHLEEVARKSKLAERAPTAAEFENLVRQLPARINLEGGHDGTYTLTYSDNEPVMAQRVVQTLLDTFLQDAKGHTQTDSTNAQRFLEEQIAEYAKRLTDAEDRLAAFKQKNVGVMPGESGDYYTRLNTVIQKAEELRAKYRQAVDRKVELEKQLDGESPTFGLGGGTKQGPPSPYDVKIAEAQKRLDTLLVQYTDKHPEVISLRETIARLEAQKKAKEPIAPTPDSVDPTRLALRALDINPVYQNMRIALSQTNVELVELKSQLGEADHNAAELRSRVDTIPEVEAQLARLNRDYEVNKTQHTALVQRLESARLSNEAQNESSSKLKVVELPTVPLRPIAPNRPVFLTAVLLLALAAGTALAVLLDQRKPVFDSSAVLKAITGLPVIGVVHRVRSPQAVATERKDNLLLAGLAASLVAGYICSLALIRILGPAARALMG